MVRLGGRLSNAFSPKRPNVQQRQRRALPTLILPPCLFWFQGFVCYPEIPTSQVADKEKARIIDLGFMNPITGKRGSLTVNSFKGIPIFANDYIGTETLATVHTDVTRIPLLHHLEIEIQAQVFRNLEASSNVLPRETSFQKSRVFRTFLTSPHRTLSKSYDSDFSSKKR